MCQVPSLESCMYPYQYWRFTGMCSDVSKRTLSVALSVFLAA